MDKKARFISAVEGKAIDRPPVGFWFHFEGERAVGDKCVEAHLEYYRRASPDFMKFQSDGFFGFPIDFPIQRASDWSRLRPLRRGHPFIEGQVERARKINNGLKAEICSYYTVFAPFSLIRFATSDELIMAHLNEDPASVCAALDAIAETEMLLAQALIKEGGCAGIFMALQGGERDRFSMEQYKKLITPSEMRVIDAANEVSSMNIGHLCAWANSRNRLELWQDYPLPIINFDVHVEGVSLAQGQRFFNGKTVMGGFNNRKGTVLFTGTREEIRKETFAILDAAPESGFILSSDCSLQMEKDIDQEHILWVIEAAQEWSEGARAPGNGASRD